MSQPDPRPDRPNASVVLAPGQSFAELARIFAEAGFVLVEETRIGSGPAPDRACWRGPAGDVRLIRDLATGNRVLVPRDGAVMPPGLRLLGAAAIADLLRSDDVVARLSGLQAAAILRPVALAGLVAGMLDDPDPRIAEHAAEAFAAIARDIVPGGDGSAAAALFSLPGWRREKLQIMRWLAHDGARAATVEPLLARALADPDWEIAVTAMLAAARLDVRALAPRIARLALPEGLRLGVTDTEHRLLLALRDACLGRLGADRGRLLPPGVMEAAGGDLSKLPPGMAAFVSALAAPLPIPPPPSETPGVSLTPTGPVLSDGRLLVFVPPLPHWLGDDALRTPIFNPTRRVTPAHGFYIDAEPRGMASYAEARSHASDVARQIGRPAALPPPDLWEMAARGSDGRRFPWGANASPSVRVDLSPWDMAGMASGPGEWLDDEAADGMAIVAGGREALNPAWRRRVESQHPHYYRCIYVLVY